MPVIKAPVEMISVSKDTMEQSTSYPDFNWREILYSPIPMLKVIENAKRIGSQLKKKGLLK